MNMYINGLKLAFVALCMVVIGGCASTASDLNSETSMQEANTAVELQAAQRRVAELESQLAANNANAADGDLDLASSLFPPNPKVGECYARVLIPATYRTVNENVLKSEASERFEIVPARYETVQEQVLVKEASSKLEVIPATYETVEERVLVKAASTKIVEVPAEYETVSETVLDKPAHTVWKKGPAAAQSANVLSERTNDTGEIMCLVEVPATYKTVEKRVLRSPARTEVIEIPAEYKTVSKRALKTPATTREIVIPAVYENVEVTQLASPAKERRIEIPAEYGVVSRTEKMTDERMEWRSVVCEVNLTQPNVAELQKALTQKGYYKHGIDGIIGQHTLAAAKEYALANDLPAGSNYIAMEVVDSLGLDI